MLPDFKSFKLPEEFLVVGAAVETGIFKELKDRALTLNDLAVATGSNQRALWIVTEALVSLGYLEHEKGRIKLTPACYSILYDQGHPDYQGFAFMHTYNLLPRWLELPNILKTGKPVQKKEDPEEQEYFIEAMSHYAREGATEIAGYCLQGLPAEPKVLDIGGGPLTNARGFARKGAKVTILDLPEVVEMMEPEIEPGLSVKMVKGDFTAGLPDGPFDLAYLGHICHIFGEKENRKLFRDVAGKLINGGTIVINDFIRGTGPDPAIFAVNMLVNTDTGGTWTYEQYKTWLEDAGFSVAPYATVGDNQLVKAHKQKLTNENNTRT